MPTGNVAISSTIGVRTNIQNIEHAGGADLPVSHLFTLFIKYVSDKYAHSDDFAPPVIIPPGASFADISALKGKPDIGDKINSQINAPLVAPNIRLARADFPDFRRPQQTRALAPTKFRNSPTSSPSSKTPPSTSPKTAPNSLLHGRINFNGNQPARGTNHHIIEWQRPSSRH